MVMDCRGADCRGADIAMVWSSGVLERLCAHHKTSISFFLWIGGREHAQIHRFTRLLLLCFIITPGRLMPEAPCC